MNSGEGPRGLLLVQGLAHAGAAEEGGAETFPVFFGNWEALGSQEPHLCLFLPDVLVPLMEFCVLAFPLAPEYLPSFMLHFRLFFSFIPYPVGQYLFL